MQNGKGSMRRIKKYLEDGWKKKWKLNRSRWIFKSLRG